MSRPQVCTYSYQSSSKMRASVPSPSRCTVHIQSRISPFPRSHFFSQSVAIRESIIPGSKDYQDTIRLRLVSNIKLSASPFLPQELTAAPISCIELRSMSCLTSGTWNPWEDVANLADVTDALNWRIKQQSTV